MTRKGREIADVLKKRRINVACLQETKWKVSKAREIGKGYKFYYYGNDGKRTIPFSIVFVGIVFGGIHFLGIMLDEKLKGCVTGVKRVSDRIIAVTIIFEGFILNVLSVYAPQTGCDDRMKEKFCEDFNSVMMDVPNN